MKPVKLLGISRGREDRWRWVKAQCALNSLSTFAAIQSQRTIPPSPAFSERVRMTWKVEVVTFSPHANPICCEVMRER